MWALVDCNTFFASVERVFHPGLRGKPVLVAGSNDGIIVALTSEAKKLGLKRGDAVFKVRDIVDRNNVAVFSGNMMLYAAMSRRIVSIIRRSVETVDQYSVDECFADLAGYDRLYDIADYMRGVADRIRLWTDIPVSVGIAPTKTLAKMGSKFAKQYPGYRSVCSINTGPQRRKALEVFPLEDVWGIGPRSYAKLLSLGVRTPLEFADRPGEWVERHFHKPGVQTWKELNGYPCIDTTEMLQRQSISTSRSFGQMITDLDRLKSSVAYFTASCANKLRAQGSVARSVTVYVCSNRFREDLQQYFNSATLTLQVGSADTIELTGIAIEALESVYRPGISYKKSGVILGDISPGHSVQQMLFDPIDNRPERLDLSKTMDILNHKYGLKTVGLAVEGERTDSWRTKSEHRSPNFLTDLDDILTVRI